MSDVLNDLRQIADAKVGGNMPECLNMPTHFEPYSEGENVSVGFLYSNNWGVRLSEIAQEAADEIEKLRAQVTDLTRLAGCAAIGKEFSEIKKGLPFVSLWDAAGKPSGGEKS